MSYTVLARKYRSQTFDDVIGQDPIAQTLKNAIKTERVAHAFLFSGTRGVGKTTMARVLAKAINCHAFDGPTTEPCCKCESCIAVNLGDDLDVIEIDGASNNGVEEVRRLRENAIYRPARSRCKIYIIDEVHMLSTSAFNALLKILEEPPDHVKFIFATTEPNKVIPTVQSRCQRFDFSNISPAQIADHLRGVLELEKIKYTDDAVLPVAKMANGSMRDALSLLDRLISTGEEVLSAELLEKFLGCPNSEKIRNLVSNIGDNDAGGTLESIEDLINTGLSEVQVVDSLVDYMRDMMVVKSTGSDSELLILTQQQRQQIEPLSEKFDIAAIIYNITTLEKLRWTIKTSETAKALLEASLLRLALSEHFLNVDALLSQAGGVGVKKKQIIGKVRETPVVAEVQEKPVDCADDSSSVGDVDSALFNSFESVQTNWQEVLDIIAAKLGKGTAALFCSAKPTCFESGLLTLSFPMSAQMSKKMCENNGRKETIESLLSEKCGSVIRLKFEVSADEETRQQNASGQSKSSSEQQNKIIQDPGVKTVLMGLGATVTNIEENTKI